VPVAELCTIVCDKADKLLRLLKDIGQMPSVKRLVLIGPQLPQDLVRMATDHNLDVFLFSDIEVTSFFSFGRFLLLRFK
jgi:hypothetical protein